MNDYCEYHVKYFTVKLPEVEMSRLEKAQLLGYLDLNNLVYPPTLMKAALFTDYFNEDNLAVLSLDSRGGFFLELSKYLNNDKKPYIDIPDLMNEIAEKHKVNLEEPREVFSKIEELVNEFYRVAVERHGGKYVGT